MASLGEPQTRKFSIGTAELRIGPLSLAMQLGPQHSIGLVDSVTVEVAQESVDLMGGFPQETIDTAIINQTSTITAVLREYSRRNIRVMLAEGVEDTPPSDVSSLVVSDSAAGADTVTVTTGDGADFEPGDIVVIYPQGRPDLVTVDRVASIATDVLTLDNGLVAAVDGTAGAVHIFKSHAVAIGNIQQVNYFACQVIQQERSTGRPVGFHFWKASIATGMTIASNATDFASNDFQLKMLRPSAQEYAAGGPLAHIAAVIAGHPSGLYYAGGDNAGNVVVDSGEGGEGGNGG